MRVKTAALVVLLLAAGCTGPHDGETLRPTPAKQMCQKALPGMTIGNATSTTVGAVRALRGGPPNALIAADAFPDARPTAQAAWCWVYNGGLRWSDYAVTPGNPAKFVAAIDGVTFAPTGPPAIK